MYWLRIPNLFPGCFQFLKHTMSHKEEYPADHSPTMNQEESGWSPFLGGNESIMQSIQFIRAKVCGSLQAAVTSLTMEALTQRQSFTKNAIAGTLHSLSTSQVSSFYQLIAGLLWSLIDIPPIQSGSLLALNTVFDMLLSFKKKFVTCVAKGPWTSMISILDWNSVLFCAAETTTRAKPTYTLWQSNLTACATFVCVTKADFLQDDTSCNFCINPYFNTKSELPSSHLPPFGENCTILSRKGGKIAGLKPADLKVTNFYLLLGFPIQIIFRLLRHHPIWRNITPN